MIYFSIFVLSVLFCVQGEVLPTHLGSKSNIDKRSTSEQERISSTIYSSDSPVDETEPDKQKYAVAESFILEEEIGDFDDNLADFRVEKIFTTPEACTLRLRNVVNKMIHTLSQLLYTPKDTFLPYQASLHDNSGFICSASLIGPHYLVTAAHCVVRRRSSLWIRIGSEDISSGGQTHHISHVFVHPDFNERDNDIAVLRCNSPVHFGPNVRSVHLPSLDDSEAVNSVAIASGYVYDENDSTFTRTLHAHMKIVARENCRNRTVASYNSITDKQICASLVAKVPDTCFGDAGGPLVVRDTLIGVYSWSSPCTIRDPDVYTNVKKFVPWIRRVANVY